MKYVLFFIFKLKKNNIFMKRFCIFIFVFLMNFNFIKAQNNSNQEINPAIFKEKILRNSIVENINKFRQEQNLGKLSVNNILIKSAQEHSEFMADKQIVSVEGGFKNKTTGERTMFNGGSINSKEIVFSTAIYKGKTKLKYRDVANEITEKLTSKKKYKQVIEYSYWNFIGIGATLDEDGKKVYVSCVFANYSLINNGAVLIEKMAVPASENGIGLDNFDEKVCRKLEKFPEISEWNSNLEIRGSEIFFKHNDLKVFKKIIRNENAIAVDIIQKEQYSCQNTENIIDFNLVNKGYLLTPIYGEEIIANNQAVNKRKKLDVRIADFPIKITGDYEFNLLIIVDGKVCKISQNNFINSDDGLLDFKKKFQILMDTIPRKEAQDFELKTESKKFSFVIPLKKSKKSFFYSDLKPYIEELDEPDFTIDNLNINSYYAFDEEIKNNEKFQNERAQSIVSAFQSNQKDSIISSVEIHSQWERFKEDAYETMFEPLASMKLKAAQKYIKENFSEELFAILQDSLKKYRYVKIDMNTTFDLISNESKQKFVMDRFKKSKKYKAATLMIQKYILKEVLAENFTEEAITKQKVPKQKKYSNYHINNWACKVKLNDGKVDDKSYKKIKKLYEKYFENKFIAYNYLYSEIFFREMPKENLKIKELQDAMDILYETDLDKELINNLNLEFQLKIFNDENSSKKLKMSSSEKSKKLILEMKNMTWKERLFLAYKFIDKKDYVFSAQLLEPFLEKEEISENFIFTYLSLCSQDTERQYTDNFTKAMHIAKVLNKERYCNLLKKGLFSIRIFENPKVKKEFCGTCNLF